MNSTDTHRQIVMIITDTQRPDVLGCYGNRRMATPHLDRLAGEGLRFQRAYTASPVCGPARAALFTGLMPHSANSWANGMALGANVPTLGRRLRDAGFSTAYIGKWHLDGGDYFGLGRAPVEWDSKCWYDMRNYLEELSPEDRVRSRQAATNRDGIAAEFTFGHRVSNRALKFLQQHRERDFLLVVSYDEPHHPYLCPPPFATMYQGDELPPGDNAADPLEDKPLAHRLWAAAHPSPTDSQRREFLRDYLGCNSFVDSEIGRVLAEVDRTAPQALVIFTSDHGELLGAHRMMGKGAAMYEEITRVPLLMRWPGRVSAGAVCDSLVSHVDLVPTVLEAAGLPAAPWLDGFSLAPTLTNPGQPIRDAVTIEYGRYEVDHDGQGGFQPIRCMYDGRHKLVLNLLDRDELYDLVSDPDELHNLIHEPACAAVRNALHDRLLAEMNRTRDPFRGYQWAHREWRELPVSWAGDGMTRQREHEDYEPRQLDYSTGLAMDQAVRKK